MEKNIMNDKKQKSKFNINVIKKNSIFDNKNYNIINIEIISKSSEEVKQ